MMPLAFLSLLRISFSSSVKFLAGILMGSIKSVNHYSHCYPIDSASVGACKVFPFYFFLQCLNMFIVEIFYFLDFIPTYFTFLKAIVNGVIFLDFFVCTNSLLVYRNATGSFMLHLC